MTSKEFQIWYSRNYSARVNLSEIQPRSCATSRDFAATNRNYANKNKI